MKFFKEWVALAVMLAITIPLTADNSAPKEPSAVVRLSEPVESDEHAETFGDKLDKSMVVQSLHSVLEAADHHLDNPFALRVAVKKVCQKKGCFFVAQDGEATIRVAFKDYGFFVPTDIAGKTVTLVGVLKARALTEDEAAHYSSDLGEEGSIRAGLMHEIEATLVQVPRG
ncbi:MAG: DUF4920 domain-containing protein [Pseudomonadota bacterium]